MAWIEALLCAALETLAVAALGSLAVRVAASLLKAFERAVQRF
jgi:hypothetical protein